MNTLLRAIARYIAFSSIVKPRIPVVWVKRKLSPRTVEGEVLWKTIS